MVDVLTAENVTKYAQDVMPLIPLDCEWGGVCESELNSWTSLREVSFFFNHISNRLYEWPDFPNVELCPAPHLPCWFYSAV